MSETDGPLGLAYPQAATAPAYRPVPNRILYLLHNALPYQNGGYAIRAHGLLQGLRRNGWDAIGVTRPGYPHDTLKAPLDDPRARTIDGVPYLYPMNLASNSRTLPLERYIPVYAEELEALVRELRPAVIHAASFHMNGIAANIVGRRLGVPTIYEIRGMHEITEMSRISDKLFPPRYFVRRDLETMAMRADWVLAITGALREMLSARVPDPERVSVLPNGVTPSHFEPTDGKAGHVVERHDLAGKVVFGYIGTLQFYEGVDILCLAINELRQRLDRPFVLLVVGDGIHYKPLQELVAQLGLESHVRFVGRVPHEEVRDYYSVCDAMVYPRRRLLVCETISPLKPFEAMCLGKAVIVSDVAALTEFCRDDETALVHRADDISHLARCLERLIVEPDLAARLGAGAREWVIEARDWGELTRPMTPLYRRLIREAATGALPKGGYA